MQEFVEGQEAEGGVGAGVEHLVGEEGGVFVGGDTAVFLEPLLFVNALGTEAGGEGFTGFVAAGLFVDALDDAFVHRFLERHTMETPAHGIAVFRDVTDKLIEEGAGAAVGGDDGELAGPRW